MLTRSFQHLLNICLPSIVKIWEINFEGSNESCLLQLFNHRTEELLNRSGVLLYLNDFCSQNFNKWIDKQDNLNEIASLLVEARENIVVETSFTYCTKALELIYKYLFVPTADDFLQFVKEEMKIHEIWEAKWDKKNLTIESSKHNIRIMLCTLWYGFNSKDGIENTMIKPYSFLAKVQRSRNYYTHLDQGKDIFKPSQFYLVNKILTAFSYGLILQYLDVSKEKIRKFTKAYSAFWFSVEYDSNRYSINYKERK